MPASAMSLIEAYQSALSHDPVYQSAVHENEAGQESRALGKANLLPNLSLSYSQSKSNAERTITNPDGSRFSDSPSYISKALTLSLRQPLFNLDAMARYRQGLSQASYSEALFAGKSQELITRLSAAYFDALLAEDQLRLAGAQSNALLENMTANEHLLANGAGTRTDVLESRARYELAQAQVVEAQDMVRDTRNVLSMIVGQDPGALDAMRADVAGMVLMPTGLAEWESIARASNPDIVTHRYTADYAQLEIERNRAGHTPRVDLVASHSRNNADSIYTFNQESTIDQIGVQITVPLYAGGSVNAQTRQASARFEGAQADLEASTNKALVEVRKQFDLLTSSQLRIAALLQAEQSGTQLIDALRKSVTGGVRINLDVLNAVQQLFTTRRDLAHAQHGYLMAYLQLRAAAGVLDMADLVKIGAYFHPTP
jgi:protease secretion system outer membrane protein